MPVPSISVRTADKGGSVSVAAYSKFGFQLASSRLIILIHGYNNDENDAIESYQQFLDNSGLLQNPLVGQVCGFLWPGDKDWGLVSFLSYPAEIGPARDSASRLHNFLLSQLVPGGWPLEVTLVCHSLGNRVGLELVLQYVNAHMPNNLSYRNGCFMAAAVPVAMVEQGAQLNPSALQVRRTLVLYSEDDAVLCWAFPLGETAAGEGILPRAVGRFGEPAMSLWSDRKDMGAFNYGHGDYWNHAESAEIIASFLGITQARRLTESSIPSRDIPEPLVSNARELPLREISSRPPGGF